MVFTLLAILVQSHGFFVYFLFCLFFVVVFVCPVFHPDILARGGKIEF